MYVNRPTKWHNPFAPKIIPGWSTGARDNAMREYLFWISVPCHAPDRNGTIRQWGTRSDSFLGAKYQDRPDIREIISDLAGKDLVCDCPLSQPCHADVLLDIANSPTRKELASH